MDELQMQKENIKKQQDALSSKNTDKEDKTQSQINNNILGDSSEIIKNDSEKKQSNIESILKSGKLKQEQLNKLAELKLKKNEALVMNNRAVLEEEKEANDPEIGKKRKRENWMKKENELKEELKFKGIDEKKIHLNQSALKHEEYDSLKRNPKEMFGWNGRFYLKKNQ